METQHLDNLAKELASKYKSKAALFGKDGAVNTLIQKTLQAALDGELTDHLGYHKHQTRTGTNARNGYGSKRLKSTHGELTLNTPRDREGSFAPQIVEKSQTRWDGFDDKIIALYAKGMSLADIQSSLQDLYGVEVSSSLISSVTTTVLEEVKTWQSRPLDALYPILYLDCIVVKVREEHRIINKSVYLALGINTAGRKELLGMWICANEGSKFWLHVLTELNNRGLKHIYIACVDGLSGFPDAIRSVYPKAKVQLCIVHTLRNSLRYVSWKHKKEVSKDLKVIYSAATQEQAAMALNAFAKKWDAIYPTISRQWHNRWEELVTMFDYPAAIRKVIYTTNAIESMNMTLRKVIKNKRVFPNDESVFKILYLAIDSISKKWSMPIRDWYTAMNTFLIEHEDHNQD